MHFVLVKDGEGLGLYQGANEDWVKSLKTGKGLDTVANEKVVGSCVLKPPSKWRSCRDRVAFDAIMALNRLDDDSASNVLGEVFKLGFRAHQTLLAKGKIKRVDKLL